MRYTMTLIFSILVLNHNLYGQTPFNNSVPAGQIQNDSCLIIIDPYIANLSLWSSNDSLQVIVLSKIFGKISDTLINRSTSVYEEWHYFKLNSKENYQIQISSNHNNIVKHKGGLIVNIDSNDLKESRIKFISVIFAFGGTLIDPPFYFKADNESIDQNNEKVIIDNNRVLLDDYIKLLYEAPIANIKIESYFFGSDSILSSRYHKGLGVLYDEIFANPCLKITNFTIRVLAENSADFYYSNVNIKVVPQHFIGNPYKYIPKIKLLTISKQEELISISIVCGDNKFKLDKKTLLIDTPEVTLLKLYSFYSYELTIERNDGSVYKVYR